MANNAHWTLAECQSNWIYSDRTINHRLHRNRISQNVSKSNEEPILRQTASKNRYEHHQEYKWFQEWTRRLVWKNNREIDWGRFQDALWSSFKTITKNPREYHANHSLPSSEPSPSGDNLPHLRITKYSKERHHWGNPRPQQRKCQHITRWISEKCIKYTKWCTIKTYQVSSRTHKGGPRSEKPHNNNLQNKKYHRQTNNILGWSTLLGETRMAIKILMDMRIRFSWRKYLQLQEGGP